MSAYTGHRPFLALAVLIGAISGCAAGGTGQVERDGLRSLGPGEEVCYQIERNAEARRLGLPWGFVRTGDRFADRASDDRMRAWTLHGPDTREDYPFATWRRVDGGVEFGPAITGSVSLRLRPESGGLRLVGSARAIGDAVPPGGSIDRTPVEGVVAHRVVCGVAPRG